MRQRLVHGKVERGVAGDAAPLAERLGDGLAERNAGVLDGVVVVDVQVALGLDRHVDQRVARKLLQHMVEEADAGGDIEAAGAVDIDGDRDRGLLGLAADLCRALACCGRHRAVLRLLKAVPLTSKRVRMPVWHGPRPISGYSASGWFSGAALSKAGSRAAAAKIRAIVG